MSPKSRRKSALVGGAKAPSLRSRLERIEKYIRTSEAIRAHQTDDGIGHRLLDAPLVNSKIDAGRGAAIGASPKTSSFPESLDVIYSDLARLQNLLEAINNRLYGDGSPASDAAAATAPYSVSDKTTTIRSQANHCMNYAESILNRF